ncbi:MAG: GNAT family N-acetyltransferase [Shimia sp.]
MTIAPVTLRGPGVVLRPLVAEDAAALREMVAEGDLWRKWSTTIPAPEGVEAEIARRLSLPDMLPLSVCDPDGRMLGQTTFMRIDRALPRLEIGSTFLRPSAQGTKINVAMKRAMLAQAFEVWGCVAVEFRTHRLNRQSRAAIEALGAQLDGVLRRHARMPDGTLRDTAIYSVTADEWPSVRAHLDWRIGR